MVRQITLNNILTIDVNDKLTGFNHFSYKFIQQDNILKQQTNNKISFNSAQRFKTTFSNFDCIKEVYLFGLWLETI